MKKIYAIVKHPDEKVGHIMEIDNALKAFQEIVGGNIETYTIATNLVIICNEEGLLLRLPYNCSIAGQYFVGTIMAVGTKGEEFTDVPIGLDTWERIGLGRAL